MAANSALRSTAVLRPTAGAAARPIALPRVNWMAAGLAFLGLTYGFFSAGSLAGSVLAEKARRDGIEALGRAKAARSAEIVLERKLDSMKSLGAIESWAAANGFVAPDRRS
jgi:hypothetical protein